MNPWGFCSKEQHWCRNCTLGPSYSCMDHSLLLVPSFTFWCYASNLDCITSFLYLEIICAYFVSRSISWIARYGMRYSLHFLEVYMVHSAVLERLAEHPFGDINIYINYDQSWAVLDLCIIVSYGIARVLNLNI